MHNSQKVPMTPKYTCNDVMDIFEAQATCKVEAGSVY